MTTALACVAVPAMRPTLRERLAAYLSIREVSKNYAATLRISLDHFETFLGRVATIDDLHPEAVNGFIGWLLNEKKLGHYSTTHYRNVILRLWRDAYHAQLIDVGPSRIRKIKIPRPVIKAWTVDGMRKLLMAADSFVGDYKRLKSTRYRRFRLSRAAFWRAFILVAWDSGLRLGDMLLLRSADVRGKDRFTVMQHKTGQPVLCKLRGETVKAIEATYTGRNREREFLFGGILCRRTIYDDLKRLVKFAGLEPGIGVTRNLRRASATAIEAATPGAGMRHLGHLTPSMGYKHYYDIEQLDDKKPAVPRLVDQGPAADKEPMPILMTPPPIEPQAPAEATKGTPEVAAIEDMLRRLLDRSPERMDAAAPGAMGSASKAMQLVDLIDEFLAQPAIMATSADYRCNLLSVLQRVVDDCQFVTTADLTGERLVAWLRARQADGLSGFRVSWSRNALIRFLKWAAVHKGAGPQSLECLGQLSAADDLHRDTDKKASLKAKAKRKHARRCERQGQEGGPTA